MTTKETKPVVTPVTVELPIQTKHLAIMFGMKGTTLRRILRSMPEYNDGAHTNYRWASIDCAEVLAIAAKIDLLQAERDAAKAAAQAAFDARVALANARKEAEAQVQAMLAARQAAK